MINSTFNNLYRLTHAELSLHGKPENLISNWSGTVLYQKKSLPGVFWHSIMLMTGKEEQKLRQTIRAIQINANEVTAGYAAFVKSSEDQTWYKTHSLKDHVKISMEYNNARAKLGNKESLDKIKQIASWAWETNEARAVLDKVAELNVDIIGLGTLNTIAQKVAQLSDNGQKLADSMQALVAINPADSHGTYALLKAQHKWRIFNIKCSFEQLFRELTHAYPVRDADFEQYITNQVYGRGYNYHLTSSLYNYNEHRNTAAPSLSYSPLAFIAVGLADNITQQKTSIDEVNSILKSILKEKNQDTLNLLIGMIRYNLFLKSKDFAIAPKEYTDALPAQARQLLEMQYNGLIALGINNCETEKEKEGGGPSDQEYTVTTTWHEFTVFPSGLRLLQSFSKSDTYNSPMFKDC